MSSPLSSSSSSLSRRRRHRRRRRRRRRRVIIIIMSLVWDRFLPWGRPHGDAVLGRCWGYESSALATVRIIF